MTNRKGGEEREEWGWRSGIGVVRPFKVKLRETVGYLWSLTVLVGNHASEEVR